MVQEITRHNSVDLAKTAPLAELQRLRSYSRRKEDGARESWDDTCDRVLYSPHLGLQVLGKFTDEEIALIDDEMRNRRGFGSARALWIQGSKWFSKADSYPSVFNCSSFRIVDWSSFGMLMDLAMQGCGTGSVLELDCIEKLPVILNQLNVEVVGRLGATPKAFRREDTEILSDGLTVTIHIGDSRQGWVKAYQGFLELASDDRLSRELEVIVDVSDVRPAGERLKGFGGVANPIKLPEMFPKLAKILNKAVGRKLNSVECCLLLDEAALTIVSGNLRRSASMRQFSAEDDLAINAKDNLWQQDPVTGQWRIDPDRDALRLANHTRVFHRKPTLEECVESVRKQFYSGEGAIMWAGEAVARANADLLNTPEKKKEFLSIYANTGREAAKTYLSYLMGKTVDTKELDHRMLRYGENPCAK